LNTDKLKLNIELEHYVYTLTKGVPKRIYLLLHGYLLDGDFILNTLKHKIPDNSLVIAPDGPFLVPYKKRDRFFAKYAWYFFDTATKNYYINFSPAGEYLTKVMSNYNPDKLPITVIGYSQGGYLAPSVANHLAEVDSVIGIACVFRNERFSFRKEVNYHQVNSDTDLIVGIDGAKEEFEKVKSEGNNGQFIELTGIGHKLNPEYLNALEELIDS
jgi:predicted esterase